MNEFQQKLLEMKMKKMKDAKYFKNSLAAVKKGCLVWSLSSFEVSCQLFTNDLNQVSSVSVLMTSSTAPANEGLFVLTLSPLLTQALLLSFAETTKGPSCSQEIKQKFDQI